MLAFSASDTRRLGPDSRLAPASVAASTASLARDGWKFLGLSTLSWPDGRQAVVTMWNSKIGDFARCFDYFDAAMKQTGGKCERSGTGL